MRIAYVSADPGVPVFGRKGASIHVQEVVRAFTRRGAQVELFAARLGGDPPPGLEPVPVHSLPRDSEGDPAARERAALSANVHLREALHGEGPFTFVYERYSLWSFSGMEYARDHAVPGLLEVNAPLIEEQAQYRSLSDRKVAERVAARAFGSATALLAVSEEVAAYLMSDAAARGQVHVVPNGVDPARFAPARAPGRAGGPGTYTVGFVGTLKPWHGLDLLVEAFGVLRRSCPGARLLIVGDGPERGRVRADLTARGLTGDAKLTGAVDPHEIPALLASVDVAVAPYQDTERFYFSPLKVYEYMAAGVPVIASRIGQIAKLIEDGETGLLCPPGDAHALAAALIRLEAEPELCARLGATGRAVVVRHHTWDAVVERILGLAAREPVARSLPLGAG